MSFCSLNFLTFFQNVYVTKAITALHLQIVCQSCYRLSRGFACEKGLLIICAPIGISKVINYLSVTVKVSFNKQHHNEVAADCRVFFYCLKGVG